MADDDDGAGEMPDELPFGIRQMIPGVKLAPAPPRESHVTVYSEASTAKALQWWETAGINAASEYRLWRAKYQHAIEQLLPALAIYTTLAELVRAYYDGGPGISYADIERVSVLPDGRRLDADTVRAAAFWRRWREINS
jgi:hypothetical protein